MNAAMRIQILADARQAIAQAQKFRRELDHLRASTAAYAAAARRAAAQSQVAGQAMSRAATQGSSLAGSRSGIVNATNAAASAEERFVQGLLRADKAVKGQHASLDILANTTGRMVASQGEVASATERVTRAAGAETDAVRRLTQAQDADRVARAKVATARRVATQESARAAAAMGSGSKASAAAAERAAQASLALARTERQAAGAAHQLAVAQTGAGEAADALRGAEDSLNGSLRRNGRVLSDHARALQVLATTEFTTAEATQVHTKALRNQTTATAGARAAAIAEGEARIKHNLTLRAETETRNQLAAAQRRQTLVSQRAATADAAAARARAAASGAVGSSREKAARTAAIAADIRAKAAAEALARANLDVARSEEMVARGAVNSATSASQLTAATARLTAAKQGLARADQLVAASAQASLAATDRANSQRHAQRVQGFSTALNAQSAAMLRAGKNTQWMGRILSQNFTLPIVVAGAASTKWALDFEQAMVRVRKVYGSIDAQNDPLALAQQAEDLEKLERGFRLVSSTLGVHQEEVAGVAAQWAQAGAEGAALLRLTELTSQASILGEVDTATAQRGLLTIMRAYELSVEELAVAFAKLNAVENETSASTSELFEVMTKAAGTAKEVGVGVDELAGLAAAMIPLAGSGVEVGTSLKTIMTRLMTDEYSQRLKEYGLATDSLAFKNKNFIGRLKELGAAWEDFTQQQRIEVAADIFGIRQGDRGIKLVNDIIAGVSSYEKALEAAGDDAQAIAIAQKELQDVLDSGPGKFNRLTNEMRNLASEAAVPLIEALNMALAAFILLFRWIQDLPGPIKDALKVFLIFLAVIGPLVQGIGLIGIMLGSLLKPIAWLTAAYYKLFLGQAAVTASNYAMVGGFVLIIAAAGGLGYALGGIEGALFGVAIAAGALALIFGSVPLAILAATAALAGLALVIYRNWDGVSQFFRDLWSDIIDTAAAAIGALPRVFHAALQAVIDTVAAAARAVIKLFSYFNPFARHSPSLVEQVRDGMAIIADEYSGAARSTSGSVDRIKQSLRGLTREIQAANRAAEDLEFEEQLSLASDANISASAMRNLRSQIRAAEGQLDGLRSAVEGQESVVDRWKSSLDAANDALDVQTDKLGVLRDELAEIDDALSASQSRLNDWLNTPVTGTFAFEDAQFDNLMSQRELQLQMKLIEKQFFDAGFAIDDVRNTLEEQAEAANAAANANKQVGDSLDFAGISASDAENRMAQLRTEIEALRGREMDLRLAGAGSDVLAGIHGEIDMAEDARKKLAKYVEGGEESGNGPVPDHLVDALKEYDRIKELLDGLQLDREILDLEEALALEPARKAIADTQRVYEQSLEVILAGIAEEKALQEGLNAERERAVLALEAQERVVDRLTDARDAIQDIYNRESEVLRDLQDQYRELESVISDGTSALREAVSAAEALEGALGGAGDAAREFGDFDVPAGGGFDISDFETSLDDQLAELQRKLEDFDPLKPVREKFEQFKEWLKGINPWEGLKNDLEVAWTDMKRFISWIWEGIRGDLEVAWTDMKRLLNWAWEGIKDDAERLGTDVKRLTSWAWEGLKDDVERLGNDLNRLWGWITTTASDAWNKLVTILGSVARGISQGAQSMATGFLEGFNRMRTSATTKMSEIAGAVRNKAREIWTGIRASWTTFGQPIWTSIINRMNAIVPKFTEIRNRIVAAFRGIGSLIAGALSGIGSSISRPINSAIDVVNGFVRGVGSAASALGVGFSVPQIPRLGGGSRGGGGASANFFASGGLIPEREVGGGFVTNRARAIVGEGSKSHPEYVIPTDPRHRTRAIMLAHQMMGVIGFESGGEIPQYSLGGVINGALTGIGKGAVGLYDRSVGNARSQMDSIPGVVGQMGRSALGKLINAVFGKMRDWVQFWVDEETIRIEKAVAGRRKAQEEARRRADAAASAARDRREALERAQRLRAQQEAAARRRADAAASAARDRREAAERAAQQAAAQRAREEARRQADAAASAARDRRVAADRARTTSSRGGGGASATFFARGGQLPAQVKQNAAMVAAMGGAPQTTFVNNSSHQASMANLPHIYPMMNGAYVKGGHGGVLAAIGEGRKDEVVLPINRGLSRRAGSSSDDRVINFYGDLSFPNVRDGSDAQDFIENLEAMV